METSLYLVLSRIGGLKETKQGGNASAETATDLTLAKVDKASQIFNLTASKYTNYGQNGNQFTVSFNSAVGYNNANYVAYAIYTDASGNECYAYSNVIANAPIA